MATSIAVQAETRNRLEALKRDWGVASLDSTIGRLLQLQGSAKRETIHVERLLALLRKRPALAQFARKHHIGSVALFGSTARGEARPDSDLDLLVEFDPNAIPGFITLQRLERELSQLLGFQVDLQTSASIHKDFRDKVRQEAIPIHGKP